MCDVPKKVIAVSFTGPKMKAMLLPLLGILCIEVLAKPQHNHLTSFKLKVLSRQKHLVPGNEAQDALVVFWQHIIDVKPLQIHDPVNWGLRFSKKACTPSA